MRRHASLWTCVVALLLFVCRVPAAQAIEVPDSSLTVLKDFLWVFDCASARAEPLLRTGPLAAKYEARSGSYHRSRERAGDFVQRLESELDGRPGLRQIARIRAQSAAIFGTDLSDPNSPQSALRELHRACADFYLKVLSTAIPPDSLDLLEEKLDVFRDHDLEGALKQTHGRLQRFDIKYGPGSPTLNPLEALLNWGAQHGPLFKPGDNGISPLEIVAAYTSSYATSVDGEATAISAAEFGLRYYNWKYRDVPSSFGQMIVPRYWTLALAVGSSDDGALESPWSGRPRLGPALGWGEFKAAYLFAKKDESRWVVSRQFQFLPHFF